MRALVQRVRYARVKVAGETVGEIGAGLLILLGVAAETGELGFDRASLLSALKKLLPPKLHEINKKALAELFA